MKRLTLCMISAFVAAVLVVPAFAAPIQIGQMMPPLTVQDLEGNEIAFNDLLGTEEKPGDEILLVFFNTSCALCQQEMKDLKKLANKSGPRVITIGIDMLGASALKRYKKVMRTDVEMYADPEFKVGKTLGFGFTPASAYFDKTGKLVKRFAGYDEKIKSLIHDLYR